MGSPLGPLMANLFMCHIKDKLALDGLVPSLLYKRYVDDTLARMPNTDAAAADFLATLNGLHPSLKFTMELPADNTIPSTGIQIIRMGQNLELVFTESRPTPVYSYIFKAMLTNVTNPVYRRPCCIVPMPCHLRQKPLMRNAPSCALYSPDLIIQLAS